MKLKSRLSFLTLLIVIYFIDFLIFSLAITNYRLTIHIYSQLGIIKQISDITHYIKSH